MKLFQLSWVFGLQSYVIFGVFRRSGLPDAGIPLGTQSLIIFLSLILSAGIGIVLGVMSWKRKETSTWWVIGAITLNIVMLLAGVSLVLPG